MLHAPAPPVGLVEVMTFADSSTATHRALDGQDSPVKSPGLLFWPSMLKLVQASGASARATPPVSAIAASAQPTAAQSARSTLLRRWTLSMDTPWSRYSPPGVRARP